MLRIGGKLNVRTCTTFLDLDPTILGNCSLLVALTIAFPNDQILIVRALILEYIQAHPTVIIDYLVFPHGPLLIRPTVTRPRHDIRALLVLALIHVIRTVHLNAHAFDLSRSNYWTLPFGIIGNNFLAMKYVRVSASVDNAA